MPDSKSSGSWYKQWHNSDHHVLVHWLILIVIVGAVWFSLRHQIANWVDMINEPGVTLKLSKQSAEIAMDPQTKTVKVGETIEANIMLDTGGVSIDGVDIYSLHYDPSILKVVDDIPKQSGVQIKPGTLMPLNAGNIVDAKSGTIKFSQLAAQGTTFKGHGILATVHFTAVAAGTAYINIDFSHGSTTDSNVASKGKDSLGRVVDAIYKVIPK